MSIEILNLYMGICKKNNVIGTIDGLKRLHKLLNIK